MAYLQRCFPSLVSHSRDKKKISSKSSSVKSDCDEIDVKQRSTNEALLKASNEKVNKLRACIADLAEENSRNLDEIDRLGRLGTVNFARKLQIEMRDVEFAVKDAKTNEASCKSKLAVFRTKVEKYQEKIEIENKKVSSDETGNNDRSDDSHNDSSSLLASEAITLGQSKAITKPVESTSFGSYSFWRSLLLRILGLGKLAIKNSNPLRNGNKAILI